MAGSTGLTAALNVTGCPTRDGFADEDSAVVVGNTTLGGVLPDTNSSV